MRSYPVKENPISSAVSEIIRYKNAHVLPSCIMFKDGDMVSAGIDSPVIRNLDLDFAR